MTRWTLPLLALAIACDPATPEAAAPTPEAATAADKAPESTAADADAKARAQELGKLYQSIKQDVAALNVDGARAKLEEALPRAAADPRAKNAFDTLAAEIGVIGTEVEAVQPTSWYTREARAESKAQLLVFWEVWCPHCRKHLPKLEETQATWGPKGLEVIGLTRLTRGATEADARAFVRESGLTYAIGQLPDNALSDDLAIRGVPAAALVKDGVVVWRGHPAGLPDSTLEAVLQ